MLVSKFVHEAIAIEHCVVMASYGHFFVHVDQHTIRHCPTLPNHRHAPAAVDEWVCYPAHLSVLCGQVL